jgi:uncharacterized membrane protein YjgN (DUF898 family)
MSEAAATLETGETLRFGETIRPASFLGLSLKNGLLNLITLTLYRFWGRTEVRRRVWSRVALNDEPFEYTGRGMELFIGFLIALGTVGVPFLLAVFGAQFLGPVFAAVIILPLYLLLFALMGAAIFLAFRYLASRTTWRGVRFNLKGSAREFGLAYLGYIFLTGFTLGWFEPAMSMRLAERLWGKLSFGDLKLRWIAQSDNQLYGPFAIGWVGTMVSYIVLIVALIPLFGGLAGAEPTEPPVQMIATLYAALFVWAVVVMLLFAPYQAALLRAVARSVHLGDARFKMDVKALEIAGLMLSNFALLVVSLGLLSPFIQARTASFLVRRLSSEGTAPLADARQAARGPKSGEGLADAFGFSPI